MSNAPTASDGDFILRLYDMRREPVLREMRDRLNFEFWPKTFEEITAVQMDMGSPMNTAWRQVISYWEMVYGMGVEGIVHPEYLVKNNGEGLLTWCKVLPHLETLREDNPRAFLNTEWAATKTEIGRQYVELLQQRFAEQMG